MRCPMALLTSKRWIADLPRHHPARLLISERREHQDIVNWLRRENIDFCYNPVPQGIELKLFVTMDEPDVPDL
ncbi:hypothetical protein TK45_07760 [Bowmanella sp. JS7-9]|nr:hypothetical protein TK45_07760 [Bowmanella sp. JS7-9]